MMHRLLVSLVLLALYGGMFFLQEARFAEKRHDLTHPLPPALQEIALGYLRQLGGEMQFITASVFYGGIKAGRDPLEYAEPLARHLQGAAHLHPRFIDTYFLCQATLPYINSEYARFANEQVLSLGLAARPESMVPPFFIGFNHFYHLQEPGEAAGYLRQASEKPGAPAWLGHLASVLAAQGGNIEGGLIWLQAMLANEEDEKMREYYMFSISQFEKARAVQQAIFRYRQEQDRDPEELTDLVPDTMSALPEFAPPFTLTWTPPVLRLHR